MPVLGSFLNLVFEVSKRRIHTIDNFSRTGDANYEKHKIKGTKPLLEFDGVDTDVATFDIKLSRSLGMNPRDELDKWKMAYRRGYRGIFLIGRRPLSVNEYVITSVSEKHTTYDGKGNVLTIELTVEITEYPAPKKKTKKKAKVKPKKNSSTAPAAKKQKGVVTITVKSVHIRNGPGVKNKVIGYAMRNDSYKVYGMKNGWYDLGGGKYMTGDKAYSKYKAVT